MVQKIKRGIIAGICIILAIFYILQRPVPINKELEAMVYTANQEECATSIVIDGSIKKNAQHPLLLMDQSRRNY